MERKGSGTVEIGVFDAVFGRHSANSKGLERTVQRCTVRRCARMLWGRRDHPKKEHLDQIFINFHFPLKIGGFKPFLCHLTSFSHGFKALETRRSGR